MKGTTITTVARILASAVAAGLAAAYAQYPHDTWIQIALAAFAVMGIHAIPAVGQAAVTPLKAMAVRGTVETTTPQETPPDKPADPQG